MSDLLASRNITFGNPQDQRLYGDLTKIQAETARVQAELFSEKSRPDREQGTEKIAKAEQKIARLEDERRKLLNRMSREAPKMRTLVVSEPVSLKVLQQRMKEDGSEVLEYLVLEHAVILWHISGDAVHAVNVFLPRSQLKEKVEAFRSSLSRGNEPFDGQTSQELFLFLIQPAMKWIKADHLIILPHDDLNYIPFQALQDPSDRRFLGERFRVTSAPNATILAGLQKVDISKGSLLAIANPEIGEASSEVQAIAKLYPGRNKVVDEDLAREADVKTGAGEYDILYLSTHGTFDPQDPLFSSLI
jgi:CHAT domain-containing protein